MALIQEFQSFIAKGNAVDMAVGVIIGGAFGKISTSLVNDVIMPPIGLLVGNAPFKSLAFILKPEQHLTDGSVVPAVTIAYGQFVQTIIDFLLISLCVFALIKTLQTLRKVTEQQPPQEAAAAPPPEPEDIKLLRDIRDSLKQQATQN